MGWVSDLLAGRRRGGRDARDAAPPPPSPLDVQIATAALLVEVSAADHRIEESERRAILHALNTGFGLSRDDAEEVFRIAGERSAQAVSLYEFTRYVDRGFTREQKATVIELLFRVAFADQFLAGEEEYLIREVSRLLHVEHPEFIAARRRAEAATSSPGVTNQ